MYKQRNWQWIFSPKCYLFYECNSDRIGQDIQSRYCWKGLSLKKLMFINLYPVSRGPSIFLDYQGRVKKRYVTRQNRNNTQASNKSSFETRKTSLESPETSIFYLHHSKGFRGTIYFLRNITVTTLTYSKSTDQQHLCVVFR